MANQKITDYPVGTGLKEKDIVDVSVDNDDGTFTTKSFTVAQLKAIAENLGNANLIQSAATRKYDIVANQLLDFTNGDFRITKSATNYVYWKDGELMIRAGAGDAQTPLSVRDNANAALFDVSADGLVTSFADFYLPNANEESPVKSLGLSSTNKVVKYNQENILLKARISQSGTNAPVLTEYINNTGLTINGSYSSVGNYALIGFAGSTLLEGNIEITMSDGLVNGDTVSLGVDSGYNVIVINTKDSGGNDKDGALPSSLGNTFRYCVLTLKKY